MSTKKGKITKAVNPAASKSTVGMVPKNLNELRSKFDGFRNIAAKFPDGAQKTQLMNGIEELYIGTAGFGWLPKGAGVEV